MSKSQSQPLTVGHRQKLETIFENHRTLMVQIIQVDEFSMDDVCVGDGHWRQMIRQLQARDAIVSNDTVVRQNPDTEEWNYINKYEWNQASLSYLREYCTSRDTLPCGCRAHVYHREEGGFGCRYCNTEESFDRETVEKVMD